MLEQAWFPLFNDYNNHCHCASIKGNYSAQIHICMSTREREMTLCCGPEGREQLTGDTEPLFLERFQQTLIVRGLNIQKRVHLFLLLRSVAEWKRTTTFLTAQKDICRVLLLFPTSPCQVIFPCQNNVSQKQAGHFKALLPHGNRVIRC